MIKHIRSLWDDAVEITDFGQFEKSILDKYEGKFEKGVLLKRKDRFYYAGLESGDIVIVDHEQERPFVRISGNFGRL